MDREQFCVSVHERTIIPKEMHVLAIKDKTAKNLIASLKYIGHTSVVS